MSKTIITAFPNKCRCKGCRCGKEEKSQNQKKKHSAETTTTEKK